jgi:hypothetical protein
MNWRVRRRIGWLIGLTLVLAAAGLIIHGFQLDSNAGACYSYEPGETSCGGGPGDGYFVAGPILLMGGIYALFFLPRLVERLISRRIRRTGLDATGTVVSVADTGTTINMSPVVGIRLQVIPADGSPPFTADTTKLVSRLNIPSPGDVYSVRYDPAHRNRVTLMSVRPQTPWAAATPQTPWTATPQTPWAAATPQTPWVASPPQTPWVASPAQTPPPPSSAANVPDELGRLDMLHASGTLTDAEYETLKQQLIQGGLP